MEDYKPFKIVSVLQGAKTFNIDSVYDAAKYLLEKWPDDQHGPKYENCKAILLKCLEGEARLLSRAWRSLRPRGKRISMSTPRHDRRQPASCKDGGRSVPWRGIDGRDNHKKTRTPIERRRAFFSSNDLDSYIEKAFPSGSD